MTDHDFEFYETAECFTRYLLDVLRRRCADGGIHNRVCYEPCAGNGAIVRAANSAGGRQHGHASKWLTNDLDPRWRADSNVDATEPLAWSFPIDWTISNTPFTQAIPIADQAIRASRYGVALYLRASIHEPLKEGERRTWFSEHPPTGIVWLPRFAHQRSRAKGIWSTDSMTSCWVIWEKGRRDQFIEYAPASVLEELEAETPSYRSQMDALNGLTGSEKERQAQWRERWAVIERKGRKAVAA